MSKPAATPKILVLSASDAEVVIEAIESAKLSTFTPAQQERLPGILRAIGRYRIAEPSELAEELIELRKESKAERQEGRKRGRPRRTAS